MYMLKAIIESSYRYARFVWTGSSMAAFLQGMRTLRPNGFSLWLSSAHILLGRPSSLATEREIMSIIFNYHRKILESRGEHCPFSADQLLHAIKSHKHFAAMMNIRPAVLDVITDELFLASSNLSSLKPGSDQFAEAVAASISAIIAKVQTESLYDLAGLLLDLKPWELAKIHKVSVGELVTFSHESSGDRSLDEFVSLLSGIPLQRGLQVETRKRQFLPPYATFFARLINPDGEFTVDMEVFRARREFVPSKVFMAITVFFFEYSHFLSPEQLATLSQAVMQECADHGIGVQTDDGSIRPVANLQELRQCHLMAKLRRHTMENRARNSKIKSAIHRRLPVRETGSAFVREGKQLSDPDSHLAIKPPGVALVSDLRVLHAHSLGAENDFKRLGWDLQVVDSIARVAHRELQQLNLTWVEFLPDGSLSISMHELEPMQQQLERSLANRSDSSKPPL